MKQQARSIVMAIAVGLTMLTLFPAIAETPVERPTFDARLISPLGTTPDPAAQGHWQADSPGKQGTLTVRGIGSPMSRTLVTAIWTSTPVTINAHRPTVDVALSSSTTTASPAHDRIILRVRFRRSGAPWGPWSTALAAHPRAAGGTDVGSGTGWTLQTFYDGRLPATGLRTQVMLPDDIRGAGTIQQTLDLTAYR